MNFLLLPLHLAEAVEATEAGESELGHALGQAGGSSPEKICRERQGRKRDRRKAGERSKLGLTFPEPSGADQSLPLPEGAQAPANPLTQAGGRGHHTTASVKVRVS